MGTKDRTTWFREFSGKKEQEAAARLADEKQKAAERGKEPFSLERLESTMFLSDTSWPRRLRKLGRKSSNPSIT